MPDVTRAGLLESLREWGNYVDGFNRLAPERQAAFLQEQGFAALRDLLGHVIGWWEEGQRLVKAMQADPSYTYVEPDTDAFNADLVRKFHAMTEAEALAEFEHARLALIRLVEGLPAAMLEHDLVRDWLFADVVEHMQEHSLPGKSED